jgi:general stress protein 26
MGETQNLTGAAGRKKLQELAMDAKICHFVTALDQRPLDSRPMSVLKVDDEGNFWFMSGKDSRKNDEIYDDPEVQLFFSNGSSSEYLSVYGYAEIIKDRKKIDELWTPIAKTWFNEGKDDPDLTLIRVQPADAYYWDTKNNKMIQLIKIATGAVFGKTSDDGIEGEVQL